MLQSFVVTYEPHIGALPIVKSYITPSTSHAPIMLENPSFRFGQFIHIDRVWMI